jgi:hypothetical protein
MQRRVLLGAGAAILVAAALGLKFAGRHEAARVVDSDIDQIAAALPPGYTATHGATDVNPITGTVTVHALAVSLDGKPFWSADTVSFTGLNQQALHDVFDPAAYAGGRPAWTARRTLIENATASGVTIPDEDRPTGGLKIGSITLHHVRGRPFMLPPTRDQVKSPAFRADAALAFALQSLDLRDLSVNASAAPQPTRLTVGTVTLRDYDGGRFAKASIEKTALDVQPTAAKRNAIHATLDLVEVKDIDATGPLKKLQGNEPPSRSILAGMRSGAFSLSGLAFDVTPGPRITLATMQAQGSSAADTGPRTGEASLQGFTVALKDTQLAAAPAAVIAAFGMTSLTMDITAKSIADPVSRLVKINEDVAFHQLGTLHVSLAAGLKFPTAPDQDPKLALLTTPIDHAVVEWHDEGLVNRAFNAAAAQMHTTPDVVRTQLAIPIVTLGFLMPDQLDAADQVTNFLKAPGTLTITLDPPQPVTLAEVGQAPAEGRAHLLGARIQAK